MNKKFVISEALENAFQAETNLELIFVGIAKRIICDFLATNYTVKINIYPTQGNISIINFTQGAYQAGSIENIDITKIHNEYRCFLSLANYYEIRLFIENNIVMVKLEGINQN